MTLVCLRLSFLELNTDAVSVFRQEENDAVMLPK